jgi:hypothetical protein
MPFITYDESTWMVTSLGCLSARRASTTALSSMRLLVVTFSPPNSSLRCSPAFRSAPQPPSPGLPLQAPSVHISTTGCICVTRQP